MNKDLLKIIKNFRKNNQDLRFGQFLWNALAEEGLWNSPEANVLFFIQDDELAKILGRFDK